MWHNCFIYLIVALFPVACLHLSCTCLHLAALHPSHRGGYAWPGFCIHSLRLRWALPDCVERLSWALLIVLGACAGSYLTVVGVWVGPYLNGLPALIWNVHWTYWAWSAHVYVLICRDRYYDLRFKAGSNIDKVAKQVARDYLDGIAWVYRCVGAQIACFFCE